MAKVCVTGAAGFIGGHLSEALLLQGHEVVGLDDFSSGKRENAALLARFPGFSLIEGSIADPRAVERAVVGATWVLHLAAIASVPLSMAEPGRTNAVNVGGTVNVLEAARRGGAQRVVLANLLAAESEKAPGEVINVASGHSASLVELIGTLKQAIGPEVSALEIEHQAAREGDLRASSADISKARALLGYEPRIQLDEGLAGVVDSFRALLRRAA